VEFKDKPRAVWEFNIIDGKGRMARGPQVYKTITAMFQLVFMKIETLSHGLIGIVSL